MQTSALKYWVLFVCLIGSVYLSFVGWRGLQERNTPTPLTPAASKPRAPGEPVIADFEMTDENGQTFNSKSLQGKIWLGSFFFTNCPGTCWKLNQALSALQKENPASDARFISITCDPENDNPEALKKYAEHFKADPKRWTFLTGDMSLVRRIGNDLFKVSVENKTHSDRAFLVDRKGEVRGRFLLTDPMQVEMLKTLLAQVEAEQPAPAQEAMKAPADAGSNAAEPKAESPVDAAAKAGE